jgi:histidinol-phosphate aminotransferase
VAVCWQHEGELLRALSNESAYSPLASVQRAICDVASKANWYAEDACECVELREKLAEYTSLQPENITLGNGSMELLDILFHTFIGEPGADEVIMPAPDYSAYTIRGKLFGPKVWLAIGGRTTTE